MSRLVNRTTFLMVTVALAILAIVAVNAVQANVLANGDFEDTTGWGAPGTLNYPPEWDEGHPDRVNAAAQQPAPNAISGNTSAYLPLGKGVFPKPPEIWQNVDEEYAGWKFNLDFAVEDPGGDADRCLNVILYHGAYLTNPGLYIIIDGDGDLRASDAAGTYQNVLVNTVVFDNDVQASPLVHHLEIVGHYDQANLTYDVKLTDSNNNIHSATGLTYWFGGNPIQGDGLTAVRFSTSGTKGDSVIDNVTLVPEPATWALLVSLGLMMFGVCGLRRR